MRLEKMLLLAGEGANLWWAVGGHGERDVRELAIVG